MARMRCPNDKLDATLKTNVQKKKRSPASAKCAFVLFELLWKWTLSWMSGQSRFDLGRPVFISPFYAHGTQLKDGKLSSSCLMTELWLETFGKRIGGSQDLVDLRARQAHETNWLV